jgi:aspartate aminotransferase-like enzyme
MALRRTRTDNLAISMLAREGIAAIWTLHLAAARAHRDGHKAMAATIIEIADAPALAVASSRYPARIGYSQQSPHEGMVDRSKFAPAGRSDPPARFGHRGALLAGRIRVNLRNDRRRIPLIHHCPPDS